MLIRKPETKLVIVKPRECHLSHLQKCFTIQIAEDFVHSIPRETEEISGHFNENYCL